MSMPPRLHRTQGGCCTSYSPQGGGTGTRRSWRPPGDPSLIPCRHATLGPISFSPKSFRRPFPKERRKTASRTMSENLKPWVHFGCYSDAFHDLFLIGGAFLGGAVSPSVSKSLGLVLTRLRVAADIHLVLHPRVPSRVCARQRAGRRLTARQSLPRGRGGVGHFGIQAKCRQKGKKGQTFPKNSFCFGTGSVC